MNTEKISKFIKELRKKQGLTQKEFAEKYHVTYQAVSKWENGKNMPDISILKKIASDNNINLDDLLEGKKTKKKNVLIICISAIIIIMIIILFIILGKEKNFEFKTISTSCEDFSLYGSLAYNDSKTSIYITNITYCGESDESKYKNIKCTLYEIDGNTRTKINSLSYQEEELVTLDDFLKDINFNVEHDSKTCKLYKKNGLYLEIEAINENDRTIIYKIPLILEGKCEKYN